jgi:hypothetical protein
VKKLLLLTSVLCVGLAANATLVNVSGANGEQSLVQIVAGTTIDITNGQLASDSYFSASSLSGNMVIEIAGYAPNNAFGIFEHGNMANKIEVFAGSAAAGATSALINLPLGWSSFGFYLANTSANFTWYSDAALNAGGGLDHFVAYQGIAGQTMTASGITFGSNDYLIGIEDLNLGDYDYNDMVVKVHLTPKPELDLHNSVPDGGATAALMGLGLCALAAIRRRK